MAQICCFLHPSENILRCLFPVHAFPETYCHFLLQSVMSAVNLPFYPCKFLQQLIFYSALQIQLQCVGQFIQVLVLPLSSLLMGQTLII